MGYKLPNITVLPGGRKVRDYDHLTVEALEEKKAAEEKEHPKDFGLQTQVPEKEVQKILKKPAKATGTVEDESLG